MAKLVYDEELVNSSLEQLLKARNTITSNYGGVQSALGIITSARGAQYLDLSALNVVAKDAENCATSIDNMIKNINSRVEEVKMYNADVETMGWGRRMLSTIGLARAKIWEGLLTGGEELVDGFLSVVGAVGGLFSSSFKDRVGNIIAKDHVGDAFHNFYYNTKLGQELVRGSFIKEDGIAANIFKIGGTALGYALVIAGTGGALGAVSGAGFAAGASAAGSSMGLAALTAGIGGLGTGTQNALAAGNDYYHALGQGIKTGAVAAVTTVAATMLFKAAAGAISKLRGADKAAAGIKGAAGVSDDAARAAGNSADDAGRAASQFTDDAGRAANKASGFADDAERAAGRTSQYADDAEKAAGRGTKNTSKSGNNVESEEFKVRQEQANEAQRKIYDEYDYAKQQHKAGNMSDTEFEMAKKKFRAQTKESHPDVKMAQERVDTATPHDKAMEAANVAKRKTGSMDEAFKAARQAAKDAGLSGDDLNKVVEDVAKRYKANPIDAIKFNARMSAEEAAAAQASSVGKDAARAAAKNVSSVQDDLARAAAQSSDGVANAARAAAKNVSSVQDDVIRAASQSSDEISNAARTAAKNVSNVQDDVIRAASQSSDEVSNTARAAATNTENSASRAARQAATQSSDDTANAVRTASKARGNANTANPPDVIYLDGGAESAARAAATNTESTAAKVVRDAITNSSDDVANAASKASNNALNSVSTKTTTSLNSIADGIAHSGDDIAKVATTSASTTTTSLAVMDGMAKVAANSADDVARVVANSADDVVRAAANSADDVARAAANSADDVARVASNSADDVARAVANSADDVARAAANSADDVAKAAANSADDVAKAANKSSDIGFGHAESNTSDFIDGFDDVLEDSAKIASNNADDVASEAANKLGVPGTEVEMTYNEAQANLAKLKEYGFDPTNWDPMDPFERECYNLWHDSTATLAKIKPDPNAVLKQGGNWYNNAENGLKYYGSQGAEGMNQFTDDLYTLARVEGLNGSAANTTDDAVKALSNIVDDGAKAEQLRLPAHEERIKLDVPEERLKLPPHEENLKLDVPEERLKLPPHEEKIKLDAPEERLKLPGHEEKIKLDAPEEQLKLPGHEEKIKIDAPEEQLKLRGKVTDKPKLPGEPDIALPPHVEKGLPGDPDIALPPHVEKGLPGDPDIALPPHVEKGIPAEPKIALPPHVEKGIPAEKNIALPPLDDTPSANPKSSTDPALPINPETPTDSTPASTTPASTTPTSTTPTSTTPTSTTPISTTPSSITPTETTPTSTTPTSTTPTSTTPETSYSPSAQGSGGGYEAIPDTGVGEGINWKDYIAPAAIGFGAGAAALAINKAYKGKGEEPEEETDSEEEIAVETPVTNAYDDSKDTYFDYSEISTDLSSGEF